MNTNSRHIKVYLGITLLAAIVAAALRTVACYGSLDYTIGHFEDHTLISIAGAIMVFAAVVSLTYPITTAGKYELRARFSNPATYIPAGGASAALVFFVIHFGRIALTLLDRGTTVATIIENPAPLFALVLSITAVGAILYFLLNATVVEPGSSKRGWLGMVTTVLLATYAVYLYFDTTLAINAPNKVVDEMAYLFASLFFLFETRISLGRGKWRAYVTFGLIAASVTAYSSIPAIIVHFAKGINISNNIFESFLTFTLFLFIAARLSMIHTLSEDKPCDEAAAIDAAIAREAAARREAEEIKAREAAEEAARREAEEAEKKAHARDINIMVENSSEGDEGIGENYIINLDSESEA